MWRMDNHFSLYLFLKQKDLQRLKDIMDRLYDLFPDVVIPRPETYDYPICIFAFPFPRPVPGEGYPDTIEKYLSAYHSGFDFWSYPNEIRFQPNTLWLEDDRIKLSLSPASPGEQSKLSQITDKLTKHYACDPCTPSVTFAQLYSGVRFPRGSKETLREILQSIDFEMTADLHSLTLELMYDPGTAAV